MMQRKLVAVRRAVDPGATLVTGGDRLRDAGHAAGWYMGFGGVKNSGTGWREAGMEALDVYSDWRYVNLIHDPEKV